MRRPLQTLAACVALGCGPGGQAGSAGATDAGTGGGSSDAGTSGGACEELPAPNEWGRGCGAVFAGELCLEAAPSVGDDRERAAGVWAGSELFAPMDGRLAWYGATLDGMELIASSPLGERVHRLRAAPSTFSGQGMDAAVLTEKTIRVLERAGPTEVHIIDHPGSEASDLAIGDLNGDGWLDIVVLSLGTVDGLLRNSTLEVMLSDGVSAFLDPVSSVLQISASFDGRLELSGDATRALVARGDGVAVLENLGDGTFGPPTFLEEADVEAVASADLDGDGVEDVLVGGWGTVSIWPGADLGAGPTVVNLPPLRDPVPGGSSVSPNGPVIPGAGDLDGDGRAELLALESQTVDDCGQLRDVPTVWVIPRDASGESGEPWSVPLQHETRARGLDAGDVDGDGRFELAVSVGGWPDPGWVVGLWTTP